MPNLILGIHKSFLKSADFGSISGLFEKTMLSAHVKVVVGHIFAINPLTLSANIFVDMPI